jgi:uncharacterized repeat protein (TIGR03809 family)
MTLRTDVARSRDLLACWRELAEKRLEYLTEMFESGRWRRYYSEFVFLENIREAKLAVETWRGLSTPDPTRNSIFDISWSAPERATGPRKSSPRPEPSADEPPGIQIAAIAVAPIAAKVEQVLPDEAPGASVIDMLALQRAIHGIPEASPDAGAAESYPQLLQNTL